MLQWLVLLRVVISFILLYTTYVLYQPNSTVLQYGISLIGGNVLMTLLSAMLIERRATSRTFVLFQLYWDFAFVSALVFITGGFDSLFNFLYILTIIFTAILTSQAHTMTMALACSAAYAGILLGQRFGWMHPLAMDQLGFEPAADSEVFVKISLNALAFISMGVLASYLAARGREAHVQVLRQREEMEALQRLNESIVQSLPIGLITCDDEDEITFANSHVADILARKLSDFRGMPLSELLPQWDKHRREGEPFDMDRIISRRGRHQTLSVTTNALCDEVGRIIGRVITLQDMTTVRRLERVAKQADRQAAVAKLAAGIAHEIRNPLASMSGSIQLLSTELKLEPVHEHLMKIVLRETDRLNELINDFLTYARPAKRRDTVGDLSQIIEEQLRVLANDPACHNIEIETNLAPKMICQFDPDQIRQLLWNLFKNALQAMEEAGGTLSVGTRKPERFQGYVEIEVTDTGPGIETDNLDSIFDPFFTTKTKGTGLGLTIAYRIVENHGGLLFVVSEPGLGTTFQVLIPGLDMVSLPAPES
ncbi:MAG: ATP-binding protein [Candidatus Lernaella stagnicola]|nr:ATP-binding protein [Candidatus Lernaella stagnicola]